MDGVQEKLKYSYNPESPRGLSVDRKDILLDDFGNSRKTGALGRRALFWLYSRRSLASKGRLDLTSNTTLLALP